jgi:hypothetical protein
MGLEGTLLVLWTPYGWALLVIAGISGNRAIRSKNWPPSTWWFLVWPLLMSVVCISWGQAHWNEPGAPAVEGPLIVLYSLTALYLAVATILVYFNRRTRPATAAVLSLGSFPLMGCAFISAMAVTGSWL